MCKSNLVKGALGLLGIGAVVGVVAYKIKEHRLNREIEFWEDFSEEELTECYEYMDEMPVFGEEDSECNHKDSEEENIENPVDDMADQTEENEEKTKPKKDKSK